MDVFEIEPPHISSSRRFFDARGSRGIYLFVFVLVVLYLICVTYQVGFFFFLVCFGLGVLVTALVSFEAALLFVPLTLTNPYTFEETGTKLHISELVLIILFGVWFLRALPARQKYIFPKEFLQLAALIIVLAILSLLKATYLVAGLQQIVRYVEVLLVFFFIIVNSLQDERRIRQIVLFLIIGGLAASLFGIGQFIASVLETGAKTRIYGWHGGNYGAFIACTLLLSFSFFLYDKDRLYRTWAVITIPCAGVALILSQTRAWIGAFFIAVLFMVFRSRRKLLGRLFLVLGAVLLFIAIVIQTNAFGLIKGDALQNAVDSAFRFGISPGKRLTGDLSLWLRLRVWVHALGMFIGNPIIGIGIGNLRFQDYFTLKMGDPGEGAGYVDNQYLQMFTEVGIVAGIAWIMYTYRALRVGKKALVTSEGTTLFAAAYGLYGSLLVLIIGGFFWVVTVNHETFALLILQIGLLVSISQMPIANPNGHLEKLYGQS